MFEERHVTNYFKVAFKGDSAWIDGIFCFDDADSESIKRAFTRALNWQALFRGAGASARLSVWDRPRTLGAWSAVPEVGDVPETVRCAS